MGWNQYIKNWQSGNGDMRSGSPISDVDSMQSGSPISDVYAVRSGSPTSDVESIH